MRFISYISFFAQEMRIFMACCYQTIVEKYCAAFYSSWCIFCTIVYWPL